MPVLVFQDARHRNLAFQRARSRTDARPHDVLRRIHRWPTRTGPIVNAALDTNHDDIKTKVSAAERALLKRNRHDFHGEWNYTISPRK
jgi:hypothetical protein